MYGRQIKKESRKFKTLEGELLKHGVELKCLTDTSALSETCSSMSVLVRASGEISTDRSRDVVKAIKATGEWAGYSVTITFATYVPGGKWLVEEWRSSREYSNED